MTKDKEGRPIFVVGRSYTPRDAFHPCWMPGTVAACVEAKSFMVDLETGETVEGGQGLFTVGDDTRWWVASDQFEDAKEAKK